MSSRRSAPLGIGRPTVVAYFTDDEYSLVKTLLSDKVDEPGVVSHLARRALERMAYHDGLAAT